MTQPDILTDRLRLRRFSLADAANVQRLAGAKEIADVTANVPHPYLDGMAEQWIGTHEDSYKNQSTITYAITLADANELIGCVSMLHLSTDEPEIGYWLGVDFWGNGYCTEAAEALINFCVETYGLTSVYGKHLSRNPASGKVMEKCGLVLVSTEVGKTGLMAQEEEFRVYRKYYA